MILTRCTLLKLLKNKWNQSITENLQLILRKCPFKEIIIDGSMGQKNTMLFFVEEKSPQYV